MSKESCLVRERDPLLHQQSSRDLQLQNTWVIMLNQKAKCCLDIKYLLFMFLSTLILPTHFKFFVISQIKQQQHKLCGTSFPACLSPHQLPHPHVVSSPLETQSLSPCPEREPWGSSSNWNKIIFLCQTIRINFPENICNHWVSSVLQLHDGKSLHLSLHNTEGRRLFSSKLCNRNYMKTTHPLLISLHTDLQHPTSKVKCSSSRNIFK